MNMIANKSDLETNGTVGNVWTEEQQAKYQGEMNTVFECIRDNPGVTHLDIAKITKLNPKVARYRAITLYSQKIIVNIGEFYNEKTRNTIHRYMDIVTRRVYLFMKSYPLDSSADIVDHYNATYKDDMFSTIDEIIVGRITANLMKRNFFGYCEKCDKVFLL